MRQEGSDCCTGTEFQRQGTDQETRRQEILTKLIECDRCKTHVEFGFTMYYMILSLNKPIEDIPYSSYKDYLKEFHLCQECHEFIEKHFPSLLEIRKK